MQENIDKRIDKNSIYSVSERFSEFLKARNILQQTVADWLGVTRQNVNNIIKGKSNLNIGQVLTIKEHCPELNTEWLLFGDGEMEDDPDSFNSSDNNFTPECREALKKLQLTIDELKEDKKRLIRTNDHLYSLLEKEKS